MKKIIFFFFVSLIDYTAIYSSELNKSPIRIAVLDLKSPGSASWLGAAVSESIQVKLSGNKKIVLVEREKISSLLLSVKGNEITPAVLGCDYLLTGSVQLVGKWSESAAKVRVNAKFVSSTTAKIKGSASFVQDGTVGTIFELESNLADSFIKATGGRLSSSEVEYREERNINSKQLFGKALEKMIEAEKLYLSGEDIAEAEKLLAEAIRLFRQAQEKNEGSFYLRAHFYEGHARELLAKIHEKTDKQKAKSIRDETVTQFREDAADAAPAFYDLGRAYEKNHNWQEALSSYDQFIKWMDEKSRLMLWKTKLKESSEGYSDPFLTAQIFAGASVIASGIPFFVTKDSIYKVMVGKKEEKLDILLLCYDSQTGIERWKFHEKIPQSYTDKCADPAIAADSTRVLLGYAGEAWIINTKDGAIIGKPKLLSENDSPLSRQITYCSIAGTKKDVGIFCTRMEYKSGTDADGNPYKPAKAVVLAVDLNTGKILWSRHKNTYRSYMIFSNFILFKDFNGKRINTLYEIYTGENCSTKLKRLPGYLSVCYYPVKGIKGETIAHFYFRDKKTRKVKYGWWSIDFTTNKIAVKHLKDVDSPSPFYEHSMKSQINSKKNVLIVQNEVFRKQFSLKSISNEQYRYLNKFFSRNSGGSGSQGSCFDTIGNTWFLYNRQISKKTRLVNSETGDLIYQLKLGNTYRPFPIVDKEGKFLGAVINIDDSLQATQVSIDTNKIFLRNMEFDAYIGKSRCYVMLGNYDQAISNLDYLSTGNRAAEAKYRAFCFAREMCKTADNKNKLSSYKKILYKKAIAYLEISEDNMPRRKVENTLQQIGLLHYFPEPVRTVNYIENSPFSSALLPELECYALLKRKSHELVVINSRTGKELSVIPLPDQHKKFPLKEATLLNIGDMEILFCFRLDRGDQIPLNDNLVGIIYSIKTKKYTNIEFGKGWRLPRCLRRENQGETGHPQSFILPKRKLLPLFKASYKNGFRLGLYDLSKNQFLWKNIKSPFEPSELILAGKNHLISYGPRAVDFQPHPYPVFWFKSAEREPATIISYSKKTGEKLWEKRCGPGYRIAKANKKPFYTPWACGNFGGFITAGKNGFMEGADVINLSTGTEVKGIKITKPPHLSLRYGSENKDNHRSLNADNFFIAEELFNTKDITTLNNMINKRVKTLRRCTPGIVFTRLEPENLVVKKNMLIDLNGNEASYKAKVNKYSILSWGELPIQIIAAENNILYAVFKNKKLSGLLVFDKSKYLKACGIVK